MKYGKQECSIKGCTGKEFSVCFVRVEEDEKPSGSFSVEVSCITCRRVNIQYYQNLVDEDNHK